MRKAWFLVSAAVFASLPACTDESPQADAASRQAEAAEARMDPEAARMVLAADSVRAADSHLIDSLNRLNRQPAKRR